jgi:hypothetical protein
MPSAVLGLTLRATAASTASAGIAIPLQPAVAGDMANGDNALLPDVKIKKFYYNPKNHGIFWQKSFGKCSHHHNGCYY